MSIWSAKNGFLGIGYVAALVEADNQDDAIAKAELALTEEAKTRYFTDESERAESAIVRSIKEVTLPFVGDELP